MIKAALFDMDGVLVDNSHMHVKSFEVMYERFNIPVEDRKNVMDFMGCGLADILHQMFSEELIQEKGFDYLCYEKERIYREIYSETIRPIEGLVDLLERMKAMGIRCAVGSSGCIENVEFVLDKCHIAPYFEAIVRCDQVTRCKPDPEIYQLAAQKLDLPPSDCLVFEDAMVGIESARKAGVDHVIALTTSFTAEELEASRPDYIVKDFREVTDGML